MQVVRTDIIPKGQLLVKMKTAHEVNYEAICIFTAIGFFLDSDTYYRDQLCLSPGSVNTLDKSGVLIKSEPWFNWHYSPRDISFDEALDEFVSCFESVINTQVGDKRVILPLSGGLDSRTQAVALQHLKKDVFSYSYSFKNGYHEARIAKGIAQQCGFQFEAYEIDEGYLWKVIDELAALNQCYTDFTHPRQMAVIDNLKAKGEVFSLGHWGDVLFDTGVANDLTKEDEVELVLKKLVKKGGVELASRLWHHWGLKGEFIDYLRARVETLLNSLSIDNSSAKIRAFKSLYWAPRWTSVNLAVFEKNHPITLPYYDQNICEFICSVPEEYLADRKLQIAYIKQRNKGLSKLTWQEHRPFSLNNYTYDKPPYNLPYRAFQKVLNTLRSNLGRSYVQRNWELQFLGERNTAYLNLYLQDSKFRNWVGKELVEDVFTKFKIKSQVYYAHPLSMLLTLSLWHKNNN